MSDTALQEFLTANQATFEKLASELRDAFQMGPKRWLSIAQAAEYSGLGVRSIKSLLSSGKLTARRPVRGRTLIDRLELDNVISTSTGNLRRGRGIRAS